MFYLYNLGNFVKIINNFKNIVEIRFSFNFQLGPWRTRTYVTLDEYRAGYKPQKSIQATVNFGKVQYCPRRNLNATIHEVDQLFGPEERSLNNSK